MKQTADARRCSSATTTTTSAISRPYGSNTRARPARASTTSTPTRSSCSPASAAAEQDEEGRQVRRSPRSRSRSRWPRTAAGVEIRKDGGKWARPDSKYNRRITASTRAMRVTGPAAGHDRLKTTADPTAGGARHDQQLRRRHDALGHLAHRRGELQRLLRGELPEDHPEAGTTSATASRRPIPLGHEHDDRFDVAKEPNEANRFGWIVEIDPFDPAPPEEAHRARPLQARGRHHGVVNKDGRVVVYMGDDERFDYVYKFVTAGTYNPDDRAANLDLLDEGTLYVARYDDDGTRDWLPLVHGGAADRRERLRLQADVVIKTRRAADPLGATKMDRPEDIEPNPKTGKVYLMLTNNTNRKAEQATPPTRAPRTRSATSSR